MKINFSNAEELIFEDSDNIKHLLPPYYWSFFEQWKMGKQFPMLRQIAKSAILDFLNHITPADVEKLEEYFGNRIIIEKLNYSTVSNIKIPLSGVDLCEKLCSLDFNYFSTYRDQEYLYISFWR
jgi:hypothetical protein